MIEIFPYLIFRNVSCFILFKVLKYKFCFGAILLFFFQDFCGCKNRKQPPQVSTKKGVLGNFAKFTGKDLCQSLFFNKVAGLSTDTLLKKRLWHRSSPVDFAKYLITRFLQKSSGRVLLKNASFKWTCQFFHFISMSPCFQSNSLGEVYNSSFFC